ncbi:histone-lysine N-methyltransferase SETMAR [Nephila pilipes]|uniref:Histone-lysine N-methyltransferase SETMAR n=1 Tax=Nephila pilipes TaxID=299642 RepID=A0A8X6NCM6_NEPPI|nr:histone-lysine N-methyltransferase SETMAR [Nephila pilipes]
MFENGRTHIDDAECKRRPSTSINSEIIANVNEYILVNRRITIDEISSELDIFHGNVHKSIVDHLQFHKACARWVSRLFTEEHKGKCFESALAFLQCYQNEGNEILASIVIGDDT